MQTQSRRLSQPERRAATRQALLDSADHAFTVHGFHAASLETIAEDAGYSKGAVYARFGGKDELFLAVYEQRFDRRMAVSAGGGRPAGTSLGERLEGVVMAHQSAVAADPAWTVAWVEFVAHATRDPALQQRLGELNAALHRRIAEALRVLDVPGEDADYLATISLVYGSGVSVERMFDPDGVPAEHLARMARALGRDVEARNE